MLLGRVSMTWNKATFAPLASFPTTPIRKPPQINVLCIAGAAVSCDLIWIELSTLLLGYTRLQCVLSLCGDSSRYNPLNGIRLSLMCQWHRENNRSMARSLCDTWRCKQWINEQEEFSRESLRSRAQPLSLLMMWKCAHPHTHTRITRSFLTL